MHVQCPYTITYRVPGGLLDWLHPCNYFIHFAFSEADFSAKKVIATVKKMKL